MMATRCSQFACLAFASLLLCACNTVPARRALDEALAAGPDGAVPLAADAACLDGACDLDSAAPPPLPYCVTGPWRPPGIGGKWPAEEYLCDGGDHDPAAHVGPDWEIEGLDTEDTIAHYDTLSGETKVQPSNCVCLYAPRFGAVRKIISPVLNRQVDIPGGIEQPVAAVRFAERLQPTTTLQNIPLQVGIGRRQPRGMVASAWADVGLTVLTPEAFQDSLAPYANLSIIRHGLYRQSEKALLAKGMDAAIVWTLVQGVEVLIGGQAANEVVGDRRAEAVYTIKEIPGCPMLRVIKVASTPVANPGDQVDFTIRFDNVGAEPVGNVTIVDNLTTRLEYVPDSAQASVEASFSTQANQAGSLILRWEIAQPLEPGQGGIVHFTCRVR
jgi:uncharacterized repeat protein (TIGR01451 family)